MPQFMNKRAANDAALKCSRVVMVMLVNDDVIDPDRRTTGRNNDHVRLQAKIQAAIRDVLDGFDASPEWDKPV